MKILLISPNWKWCEEEKNVNYPFPPYNLCLLAAIVRDKKLLGIEIINDTKKLSLHLYENPNNMQRPIFFNGNSYTFCRPTESINQLI